jgi:hypothetical protein
MPETQFIGEVWSENLEEEMAHLRDLVEEYPYLSMVRFVQSKHMSQSQYPLSL